MKGWAFGSWMCCRNKDIYANIGVLRQQPQISFERRSPVYRPKNCRVRSRPPPAHGVRRRCVRNRKQFGNVDRPDGRFMLGSGKGASSRPAGPAARVRTLYISVRGSHAVSRMDQISVLHPSPLLRAIVDDISRVEVLRADDAAAKRLAGVLLDQLPQQRHLPLFVPALTSPLARRVGAALAADPADTPRATDLAAELGVSTRTLERAFIADGEDDPWRVASALADRARHCVTGSWL